MNSGQDVIFDEGVSALRLLASRLRAAAEKRDTESALWLSIRDVEGLAMRAEEVASEQGRAVFSLGGQDFAVLDDVVNGALERRLRIQMNLTLEQLHAVRQLANLLAIRRHEE